MTRFTLMAGALGAALMTSSAVFAQVAPNPNNPNDAVAETFTPPPYGETINLETAKKVAEATAARGHPVPAASRHPEPGAAFG